MKLTSILTCECIRVPLNATDKNAAITELVDLLVEQNRIQDRELVLKTVLERESAATTGIGKGLAVPHGKCTGCTELVMAVGKPATPIDFQSNDGQPVSIIVLLASPVDMTGPHIQALAQIARLMSMDKFRTEVSTAASPEALYEIIRSHEH